MRGEGMGIETAEPGLARGTRRPPEAGSAQPGRLLLAVRPSRFARWRPGALTMGTALLWLMAYVNLMS